VSQTDTTRSKPRQTYHALVALGFSTHADRTEFVDIFDAVPSTTVTLAELFEHDGNPGLVLGLAYTARGANRTDIASKLRRAASLSGIKPTVLRDVVGLSIREVVSTPNLPTGSETARPEILNVQAVPASAWQGKRLPLDEIVSIAVANAEHSPGGFPRMVTANGMARMVYDGHQRPAPESVEDRNALVDQMVAKATKELNGTDAGAIIFLTHHQGARFTVVHAFDRDQRKTRMAPVSGPEAIPGDWSLGEWAEVPDYGRFEGLVPG
jgi:hypothetical protein